MLLKASCQLLREEREGRLGRKGQQAAGVCPSRRTISVASFDEIEHEGAALHLSAIHKPLLALSTRTMSQTQPDNASSPDVQSVLNVALEAYEEKTKIKLLTHPLATQI